MVGKNEDLFRDTVDIHRLHWISGARPVLAGKEYQESIRYSHRGATAQLHKIAGDHYRLVFSSRQRAVAPGQFAVIYDEDEVMGSGEICRPPANKEAL